MANKILYKILETASTTNPTNLAAAGKEEVVTKPTNQQYWNFLLVQNRDAVDIRIHLDNTEDVGKDFDVQASGGIFKIEPEDGIAFQTVVQENLDAATAETAGKIMFTWARKEPING